MEDNSMQPSALKRYLLDSQALTTTKSVTAITLDSLHILRDVLKGDIMALWAESPFGRPLEIAVWGNHVELATAAVQHFAKIKRTKSDVSYASHFESAIKTAFTAGRPRITLLLLKAARDHFSHLERYRINEWNRLAISTGNKEMIKAAVVIRSREALASYVDAYTLACRKGDPALVRIFFDNGHLSIHHSSNGWGECPLSIAVSSGHLEVVRAILLLGAHPDGCWTLNGSRRPLWIAIVQKSLPVVQLLLEPGANPELVTKVWETAYDGFQSERGSIGDCLAEAVKRHEYFTDKVEYETVFAANI